MLRNAFAGRALRTAPVFRLGAPSQLLAASRIAPIRFYSGPGPLTQEFVFERVSGVLSNCDKIEPSKIQPSARLEEDLGLDSLDVVDALFYVEEEFTVQMPDHEANEIKTVEDVVAWVLKQPDAV